MPIILYRIIMMMASSRLAPRLEGNVDQSSRRRRSASEAVMRIGDRQCLYGSMTSNLFVEQTRAGHCIGSRNTIVLCCTQICFVLLGPSAFDKAEISIPRLQFVITSMTQLAQLRRRIAHPIAALYRHSTSEYHSTTINIATTTLHPFP